MKALARGLRWAALGIGLVLLLGFGAFFFFVFEKEQQFWDNFERSRPTQNRVKLAEVPAALRLGISQIESTEKDCTCTGLLYLNYRRANGLIDDSQYCNIEWQIVRSVNSNIVRRSYSWHLDGVVGICNLVERLSKEEVLEEYLNRIYFGHDQYGVVDASKFYFKKQPSELSLEDIAGLVTLVRGPQMYSPIEKKERFLERRTYVLRWFEENLPSTVLEDL